MNGLNFTLWQKTKSKLVQKYKHKGTDLKVKCIWLNQQLYKILMIKFFLKMSHINLKLLKCNLKDPSVVYQKHDWKPLTKLIFWRVQVFISTEVKAIWYKSYDCSNGVCMKCNEQVGILMYINISIRTCEWR